MVPPPDGQRIVQATAEIKRAICCPAGVCIAPGACYAEDRSRSYPVHIHEAAEAVVRLLTEQWRAASKREMRDGNGSI